MKLLLLNMLSALDTPFYMLFLDVIAMSFTIHPCRYGIPAITKTVFTSWYTYFMTENCFQIFQGDGFCTHADIFNMDTDLLTSQLSLILARYKVNYAASYTRNEKG